MDTIKKVFSEAYYPEKYMKEEDNQAVDNSINYAQPYESDLSKSLILEEVKRYYSEKGGKGELEEEDKESSFQYAGGDHTQNFDSSKDVTNQPDLPPIRMEELKRFDMVTDNIFSGSESQRNKSDRRLNSARDSNRDFNRDSGVNNENDDENDNDLSVYEVRS